MNAPSSAIASLELAAAFLGQALSESAAPKRLRADSHLKRRQKRFSSHGISLKLRHILQTYTYNFSCKTARLATAICNRFPNFVGTIAEDSETPSHTIIRIEYGISESDKPILDEIVKSVSDAG